MATTLEDREYQTVERQLIGARTNTEGSFGTFGISLILPVLVYIFAFACNDITGCPAPSLLDPKNLTVDQLKREVGWPEAGIWGLGDTKVTGVVLGYYVFNALLYRFLPATEVEGVQLASGGRLKYRFNSKQPRLGQRWP